MKKQILRNTAMLGLFLMLAVATANAQTASRAEVTVPFDFLAGKVTLKAGSYSVKKLSGNTIAIRSVDGETTALVNAQLSLDSRDFKAGQRLVFNKYGDRYFLSQVWLSIETGRQLFTSAAEVNAAREYRLANKKAKPERVDVAMQR
jgi:hypothetical protein